MPENKRIIHQSAEQSNFKITILYPAKINIQYFHTVVRVYYCLALAGKKKRSFEDVLHKNVNAEGKSDLQDTELCWQLTANIIK